MIALLMPYVCSQICMLKPTFPSWQLLARNFWFDRNFAFCCFFKQVLETSIDFGTSREIVPQRPADKRWSCEASLPRMSDTIATPRPQIGYGGKFPPEMCSLWTPRLSPSQGWMQLKMNSAKPWPSLQVLFFFLLKFASFVTLASEIAPIAANVDKSVSLGLLHL